MGASLLALAKSMYYFLYAKTLNLQLVSKVDTISRSCFQFFGKCWARVTQLCALKHKYL